MTYAVVAYALSLVAWIVYLLFLNGRIRRKVTRSRR